MSFRNLRSQIGSHLVNVAGWRTNRKIVVIESDDWGSIRMPSRAVYDILKRKKLDVESDPFNKYDSLETEEDIEVLLELLGKFQDKNGVSPIITTNFVIANPNFERIKKSKFEHYYFESLDESYKTYPGCRNSKKKIEIGISTQKLYPQFHGREHVNTPQWIRVLRNNGNDYRIAFEYGTYAITSQTANMAHNNLLAAFDYKNEDDRNLVLNSIQEGLSIFESTFGYKSLSFIAPCYIWDRKVEEISYRKGVQFIQTTNTQFVSGSSNQHGYRRVYNYLGKRNVFGQIYLNRNCYFEPSTNHEYDWISRCLNKIQIAFTWRKPAIISMHRVNFIGSIFPENRTKSLRAFNTLLERILKAWPEVEFMNTCQLGELIRNSEQN